MTARYAPADFFLLRAPALPASTFLDVLAGDRAESLARLRALADRPEVRRALYVASPDLVDALAREPDPTAKRGRRVYSRLLRYLTRMATRPTPFGCFSGVALGDLGPSTTASLGTPVLARNRVRTDMGWLLGVVKALEEDEQLRPQLLVVVNASAHRSGDRLVLPYADVHGRKDNRSVRVRATAAVDALLRLATTPVPYGRLVAELAAEFPGVPQERVAGLVGELWDLHFLISDLRPPQSSPFPEQHVLKRLAAIQAPATEALREVITLTHRAATGGVAELAALTEAQRALSPEHREGTYQLDSALDLRGGTLHHEVGEAVAEAVDCLMRLSAAVPGHNQHLAEYREAFTERYGLHALVPVLELLSPDTGLDAPAGYTEPPRTTPLPHNEPRPDTSVPDKVLTEFATQAWWSGAHSVELTDAWLDRLAPPTPPGGLFPVLDAFVQLQCPDGTVDSGRWTAVLRELGLAYGGRTAGRFFDLLGEDAQHRLRAHARAEEALQPEAVFAELCFLPTAGRAANVAFRPLLREHELVVNGTPTAASLIVLEDLCAGVAEDRFFLWSRSLRREVVVTQTHMLSPHLAPNAARFVLEVGHHGHHVPSGFRWGPLEGQPFLPRVTRGRVVLRPAEWTLRAEEDLTAWRARWRVPRYVYLAEDDNRLLLDLDRPLCLDELATELARTGSVVLHEMLPAFDEQWLRDESGQSYLEDVVVPLVARSAADTARSPVRLSASLPDNTIERHLPGGEWAFLKVYCPFGRHDDILTGPLPAVVEALRPVTDRWFYLRYADPQPHLRLRFRAVPGAEAAVLAHLLAWGRELVGQGLAFDTAVASYVPENARYGGPRTFDLVEQVFSANSDATLGLLQLTGIRPEFLAIASVDTMYRQWGLSPRERMDLLPPGDDVEAARKEFQLAREYLGELLVPWDARPHAEGRAHHSMVQDVLLGQENAVQAASAAVCQAEAAGALWGSTASVLGSLAHMQVNRLLPVDLRRESQCYALWRHILRAVGGRPSGR
ncbi:thiopeptide-type bacteriocin biosynthesis protein [Crossiella equi]|uniref:Thiopeptide-type bacteriocin biosynthesis protein n=1 Tax=Crossiella equi TaxID=130796 RepID=A0ABS5ARL0_9PSEU|nr:lantibiotic dehydratase [Crossiella equi]MBP2479190.1 thiopeptide-type bacteriocin biosynthesis protein [Crossiella equi]